MIKNLAKMFFEIKEGGREMELNRELITFVRTYSFFTNFAIIIT